MACRIGIATFFILLGSCGNPNQRLDEYVFYDGPQLRLKVVRFYRNIPFNQLGEQAVVMCQSENTLKFTAQDRQDAGWRVLGAADAGGSKNAQEVALRMKDDYDVFENHILVGKTHVFNISFDACGRFINWDPGRLPKAMINPVEKPDSCAPNGPLDCRYHDFEGNRAPRYEQIRVTGMGQVSFTARTPTFRDVESLHVQTTNNGAVWHVDTVGFDKADCYQAREGVPGCVDVPGVAPDTLRSLSVALLENGAGDVSLMDWFESVLPPRSIVVWPDAPGACGERREDGVQVSSTRCAEIRFNDIEGNNGSLYVAMKTDSGNRAGDVSFHSGVYRSGDGPRPVSSLSDLRESLIGSAE